MMKKAAKLLDEGRIDEAAARFEVAGRSYGGHAGAMTRAGECYYLLRDYVKAAECYASVPSLNLREESTGLNYARALKQSGLYETAIAAFKRFAQEYEGGRKAEINALVGAEIRGCQMALEWRELPISGTVSLLPPTVNSRNNEFGPVAFSERLLYFSVLHDGRAVFMRTQKPADTWEPAAEALGLPVSLAGRFGNGTFSADATRFYCTQCAEKPVANSRYPQCDIYVLTKGATGWSEPLRLRDYINLPGRTAMHPYTVQEQGKEYLYFSAERPGGQGGLDLYVCEREINSGDIDFSLPQNLGTDINTAEDEVTPFYDPFSRILWFSSKGHATIGGMDIFKSNCLEGAWSPALNAGLPLNSPADDLFYNQKKNGYGGFFISNRLFGEEKKQTRDQDIFEFFP